MGPQGFKTDLLHLQPKTHSFLTFLDTIKWLPKRKQAAQGSPVPKENAASESGDPIDEGDADTVVDEPPKFVEWCAEEENQELIANFNAQYMKVQKGWSSWRKKPS